jgi:hypothetical protein
MIINNNQNSDLARLSQTALDQTQGPSRTVGSAVSTPATADNSTRDDSFSLSNVGNLVQQALNPSSSGYSARTQELRALVQSNQYQPDAQAVSGALVDSALSGV